MRRLRGGVQTIRDDIPILKCSGALMARGLPVLLWLLVGQSWLNAQSAGLDHPVAARNRVTIDVYLQPDSERCQQLVEFVSALAKQRSGIDVVKHDVAADMDARRDLYELGRQYGVARLGLPAVHAMDQFQVGYSDDPTGKQQIESLLAVEVFTRSGCPHCRDAKAWLQTLSPQWPALRFAVYDITSDMNARNRMMSLAQKYHVQASSVPAFHLCRQLKIGFIDRSSTGRELERLIRKAARSQESRAVGRFDIFRTNDMTVALAALTRPAFALNSLVQPPNADSPPPLNMDEVPPLPADELPELPADMDGPASDDSDTTTAGPAEQKQEMEVPFFGRLSVVQLGMPLFTFLVGLVDGFNPCAMWVLMFLLSVLVNIRERSRIIAIAGTFVFVSGLAYYAFMAAWLNVFMLIGMDRYAQVALGCIAVVIGIVNIKDFFAFRQGISFSIPDSAKPGIYARVRRIVAAKHMWAALSGAVVLAVLVNIIELLCTAGLPALYTQILMMQGYPALVNYLYLLLYIIAYMLDDSILVTIVVITLSRKKLQEGEGRWLKLFSGAVILILGVIMIFKPGWLI